MCWKDTQSTQAMSATRPSFERLPIFLIPAKLNMHKFSIEIDWIVAVNIRTLI